MQVQLKDIQGFVGKKCITVVSIIITHREYCIVCIKALYLHFVEFINVYQVSEVVTFIFETGRLLEVDILRPL